MRRVALFLDRDGTLNVNTHYTHLAEDLYLCDGVIDFFRELHNYSMLQPIVVTNQSGVDRGYYTKDECLDFEIALEEKIACETQYQLWYEHFYHSWSKNPCLYRKPNPGMLLRACKDHDLIPGYMIGDKDSDVEAGHRAGCRLSFKLTKDKSLLSCLHDIDKDLREWDHTREYF